jgi:parallel beta-helix repeat protein
MQRRGMGWLAARGAAAFVVALAACAAMSVVAAEYVVAATGGSNSNPGTAALPWATLQYAANQVAAGDRVVVRPGNYTGFYLDTSGAAGSPIEFIAEPGARITQRNATTPDGVNLELASHIVIDGFEVIGMPRAGVRSVGLDDAMAEFVTIRNVHAFDNGVWGIFTGHVNDLVIEHNETSGSIDEHGIYVSNSGDRPVLRGNMSWGNHGSGIHMNGDLSQGGDGIISGALVTGNWIFDNAKPVNGGPLGGGSGINMDGVQDSRIENNLLYGNRASGISLYAIDGAEGSSGNTIINNTVHQPANGRWALNIQDGSTDATVLNNILVTEHSFRGAIDVSEDSLPGLASDYNVVASRFTTNGGDSIQTLAQWQAATGQDGHSQTATAAALFASWATGDYSLKSGSAAVDAGAVDGAPAVDLAGLLRPQGNGFDVGALELAANPPALTADFDESGAVDAADLAAWRVGFGTTAAAHAQGDADGDLDVDGADFLAWQQQVGMTAGGARAVPEPPALMCVGALVSAVGVAGRRKARL